METRVDISELLRRLEKLEGRFPKNARASAAEGHVHKPAAGGGGGGTTIIVQKDDATIEAAATTIDFDDTDAAGIVTSSPAGEANVNMAHYGLLDGRAGGQIFIGGTVDNTYLSLRGNSVDLTDPVKLLSPLQVAASPNNIIQDSGSTTRVTLATSSPHVLLGAPTIGTTVVVRINDHLGVGVTPGAGSTSQRLIVGTFANLGVGSSTLMSVNIGGVSTAIGTFRQGFQFAGIYDIATFNLTVGFTGIAAVPTIADSIGGGTIVNLVPIRAGYIIGFSDNGVLITNSSAFEAVAPTNLGFGFGPIATNRGLRVLNQGLGIITTSVGVDVEAQSGSATASIGVRIALATTYALQLSDTGGTAAGGIQFGTDLANLYRSVANTLKTDGDFICRTINTGNGALEVAAGQTILDFGAFPGKSDTSQPVTGQTGIGTASIIEVNLTPVATADHTADEHLVETLRVFAGNIVAGTGFTIYGVNDSQAGPLGDGTRIWGKWTVNWQWN